MSAKNKSKRNRIACDSGSVLAEFAISASVFVFFLIGTFDLVRVYQIKGRLQSATDRIARLSALGGVLPGMDRISSIQTKMRDLSGRNDLSLSLCPATQRPCTGMNVGSEKEWMYFRATTQVPLLLSAVSITLTSESMVRNEPVFKDRTIEPQQTLRAIGVFKPTAF